MFIVVVDKILLYHFYYLFTAGSWFRYIFFHMSLGAALCRSFYLAYNTRRTSGCEGSVVAVAHIMYLVE